jgi:hypothetical protein
MKFAEFDQYSEDLLMAQYDVSEIISHELMKGEIREDFLINTLASCSDPRPYFVKGTLSDETLTLASWMSSSAAPIPICASWEPNVLFRRVMHSV